MTACIGLLFSGCGGEKSDRPELGTVSGKVLLDGQPLSEASVMFLPEKGRASFGTTDTQGNYSLKYTDSVFGAKIGTHQVQITTAPADEPEKEKLPAKYHSESTLQMDVKPGRNECNFTLTSK